MKTDFITNLTQVKLAYDYIHKKAEKAQLDYDMGKGYERIALAKPLRKLRQAEAEVMVIYKKLRLGNENI